MAGPIKTRRRAKRAARRAAEVWDNVLLPGQQYTEEYSSWQTQGDELQTQLNALEAQKQELKNQNKYDDSGMLGQKQTTQIDQQIKQVKDQIKVHEKKEPVTRTESNASADEKELLLSMENITQDLLVNSDPNLVKQQQEALDSIFDIYDSGGYTASEQAQIRQAQQQAARYEQAQRGAAEERMAARGMADGGASIAADLAAQQGGADRASASADNIAVTGQQRAMQALMAGTQQANQMRSADDAIKQFNTQYKRDINQRNTQRKNVMETNEATRDMRNQQRNFANQMAHTGALSGANQQYAQQMFQSAQQQFQNILGGIQFGMDSAARVGTAGAGAASKGVEGYLASQGVKV